MGILATLSFIDFRIIDVLDILIVAILLFEMYKLTKGTAAVKLFWLIAFFYVASKVVAYFHFTLLSELIGELINVGILAIIILFQPEIRKFLIYIGNGRLIHFFSDKFAKQTQNNVHLEEVEAVREACQEMAETKTGALIVLRHGSSLERYIETGDTLNASINRRLIENVFFKNSPLHDGAMILSADSILAARCTLPISENPNIPPQYGMRHKAALGLSEVTDASVIVVSEQTGEISFVERGEMQHAIGLNALRLAIENSYK
jgi:TIGR00159 family protein